jgi:hypothetical protein
MTSRTGLPGRSAGRVRRHVALEFDKRAIPGLRGASPGGPQTDAFHSRRG